MTVIAIPLRMIQLYDYRPGRANENQSSIVRNGRGSSLLFASRVFASERLSAERCVIGGDDCGGSGCCARGGDLSSKTLQDPVRMCLEGASSAIGKSQTALPRGEWSDVSATPIDATSCQRDDEQRDRRKFAVVGIHRQEPHLPGYDAFASR